MQRVEWWNEKTIHVEDVLHAMIYEYGGAVRERLAAKMLKCPLVTIHGILKFSESLEVRGGYIRLCPVVDSEYGPVFTKELERLRQSNTPTPDEIKQAMEEIRSRYRRNKVHRPSERYLLLFRGKGVS